jgi:hypothetical protein
MYAHHTEYDMKKLGNGNDKTITYSNMKKSREMEKHKIITYRII